MKAIGKKSLSIDIDTHKRIGRASVDSGKDMYVLIADAWDVYEPLLSGQGLSPNQSAVITHCPNCRAKLRVESADQTELLEVPPAEPSGENPLVAEFHRLLAEEPGGRDELLAKYIVQELNRRLDSRGSSTHS